MQRGLVPRFFYGKVCFAEHLASCTLWGLVAPLFALALGLVVLFSPWQRFLQHPFRDTFFLVASRTFQSSGWQKRVLACASALPPSLLVSPLLTVVAFAALCPLCARPQTTLWETLEYTLWPPSQLLWGHTEEARGRAVAVGVAILVEHALELAVTAIGGATRGTGAIQRQKESSAPSTFPKSISIAPFLGACVIGAFLLRDASGPGTELFGCFVMTPAILLLSKLADKLYELSKANAV